MSKYLPIYLYGAIIILAGLILLFSLNGSFTAIKWSVAVTLTFGGLFAFFASRSSRRKQVQFSYHQMHALAMLVYGISIILFCDTLEKLISFTAFLFIFYSISEVIFCNWILELKQRVIFKIIIIRLILGLAIGIATVIAMSFTDLTLEIFGLLFIAIGFNIMLYAPVMKKTQETELK